MSHLIAFLTYAGPLLLIMLKVGLVIGGTGSVLEEIGKFFKLQRLITFGQLLEHVGADVPGFVDKIRKLLGAVAPAAALMLIFGLSFSAGLACSRLASVDWPKQIGDCAAPLEPGLTKAVGDVLAGTGDVESGLAGLVSSGAAADAVECAVAQLLRDIGFAPRETRAIRIRARGKEFLDSVAR